MIETIINAAIKMHVSPALLLALCGVESDFRNVVNQYDGGSPSYGVCQVKLATAEYAYGVTSVKQLMKPRVNAETAAKYLRDQILRYEYDLDKAIAAYNAGTVKYNKKGLIKNRKYVTKVKTRFEKYKKKYAYLSHYVLRPYEYERVESANIKQ